MKIKNIILIIVLAAMGLSAWVIVSQQHQNAQVSGTQEGHHDIWYCPMHPHYTSDKPGDCPICSMKLVKRETAEQNTSSVSSTNTEKKILYWTDTMMPGYKSDHPGKSPMGMDMTPVYEQGTTQMASDVQGYANISVSAQKQQLIGVRTGIVSKKTVFKTIRAAGRIVYDPDLYKAEEDYVESYIAYSRLNRRVNQGSYTIQDAQRKLKEAELDLIHMGASEQTIAKLRQNKFPDHNLLSSHVQNGEVLIYAQIFEDDLGFVDVGQKAIVEIPAYHQTLAGAVVSVEHNIDPVSRTKRIHILLSDVKGELSSDMFVNVSLPVELSEGIVVPREAIMDTGVRKIVFVQKDEGTFEPRVIQTGWETDDGFEVTSGLKEGDTIVLSGNFLLDSESRVQAGLEDSNGQ